MDILVYLDFLLSEVGEACVRNKRLTSTQLKMELEEISTSARTVRRRLDDTRDTQIVFS